MPDPMACPHCRRGLPTGLLTCLYCRRPTGPRLASLMDALPAEEDRPAGRPKLNPEEIEPPEARSRAKGSMAFEIGMGLLCIAGGAAWFVGGLSLGMFFKYPVVLLIGGVGLIVDGVRRKVR